MFEARRQGLSGSGSVFCGSEAEGDKLSGTTFPLLAVVDFGKIEPVEVDNEPFHLRP